MLRRGISLVLAVAALFSLVLFSCGGKKEGVIAKVGDKTITLGDFNIAYKDISIFSRPPLVTYEDCESFLNTLIHKNLMVDEAVARGFDKDPALQEEMQQWKMQASIRALFKDVAESDLEISLAEVEDYYRRSRVSVKARHIQVASLAEAEEVAAKLASGEDFAKLAMERSNDVQTASLGGEWGTVNRGILEPALERVVFSLNVGEVSDPVRSARGYHLVEVTERIEPSMDNFESQRHACAAELRGRRRNEAWNTYLANVKAAQAFEVNEENVAWLNDRLPERGSSDPSWAEMSDADKKRVLVTYAGGSWTAGRFIEKYRRDEGVQPYTSPDAALIKSMLEAEVVNKANYAEAQKRGLTETDAVVRAVHKQWEGRLVDRFFADLTKDVTVPEEKIREAYEKQKDALVTPERAKLQLISVRERDVANRISKKLQGGASFRDLAVENNVGRLKEIEGVLDLLPRENLPAELQSYALDRLAVGETTPVVEHAGGFFIAKLLERDPEHPTTFDEARQSIEEALASAARDATLGDWLTARKEELGVEIFPDVLNLLLEEDEETEETS